MKVSHCSHVAELGRGVARSLATALLLWAMAARGDELTPEVTAPLLEFRAKRLAIEARAAEDTTKERQVLTRKLEKLSKAGTKKSDVSEQATAILKRVEDPTFMLWLMHDFQPEMSKQQADIINLAYTQGRFTAEAWTHLPGAAVKVTLRGTRTDIDVQPGDFVLICPHPDQQWRRDAKSSWTTFHGSGNSLQVLVATIVSDKDPQMFYFTREKGVLIECGVKGRLALGSKAERRGGEGTIECKVYKITQH